MTRLALHVKKMAEKQDYGEVLLSRGRIWAGKLNKQAEPQAVTPNVPPSLQSVIMFVCLFMHAKVDLLNPFCIWGGRDKSMV